LILKAYKIINTTTEKLNQTYDDMVSTTKEQLDQTYSSTMNTTTEKLNQTYNDILSTTKEQLSQTSTYSKIKSQELKDEIDSKLIEMAELKLKEKLAIKNKTFNDYTDKELEILIFSEKQKIIADYQGKAVKVLVGLVSVV